jgi:3-oxoacyl-[acyl-carrier-protein] synthase II
MARIRPSELVLTGARGLIVAPGAPLTPERWAGAPARLMRMDRLCALTLVAADGALLDAALPPTAPEWNGERTAVVLGTAYGCHATNEDYYRGLVREGLAGASPRLFAYTLPSSPVGEVSIHYGIRGPATALGNGLTSGVDALGEGMALLRAGRAERVLVCAADVATPLLGRLLAPPTDVEPLFAATPLVDGAAALLLERASDAATRGATPRARVLAIAATFHANARAAALSAAIGQVLAEADVSPAAVSRLIAAPADAAVARARGVGAPGDGDYPAGALGAAPLIALARSVVSTWGSDAELTLLCAGDDGGAGAAALLAGG